jgi:hypothetical protein
MLHRAAITVMYALHAHYSVRHAAATLVLLVNQQPKRQPGVLIERGNQHGSSTAPSYLGGEPAYRPSLPSLSDNAEPFKA